MQIPYTEQKPNAATLLGVFGLFLLLYFLSYLLDRCILPLLFAHRPTGDYRAEPYRYLHRHPKRINPKPSLSVSLEGINTVLNTGVRIVLRERLAGKGVVRVYGLADDDNVLIIEVRMTNGLYKTAGRVHVILQELLSEELDLDRTALRPNTGRAKLSRAAAEIHQKPTGI